MVALTVSIMFLVVGCFSLWISRNNATLADAQAKPIPTVLRASFAPQDEKQPGDPHERVLILVTTFAKSRMSGERYLFVRNKNPDFDSLLALGCGVPRKDEGGLLKVGLARQVLHFLVAQTAPVEEHGQRIAL